MTPVERSERVSNFLMLLLDSPTLKAKLDNFEGGIFKVISDEMFMLMKQLKLMESPAMDSKKGR